MLKSFSVRGLHGTTDIKIPFYGNHNILLSENGRGKTTILNLLHGALSRDVAKLRRFHFDRISISLEGMDDELVLFGTDIQYYSDGPAYNYLRGKLDSDAFAAVLQMISKGKSRHFITQTFQELGVRISAAALRDLMEDRANVEAQANEQQFFERIRGLVSEQLIFLPTYRRVEQSLDALGIEEGFVKNQGLNFGLDDVLAQISVIRANILQASNESFNAVSGELLTKMIDGITNKEEVFEIIDHNRDMIPLILRRMGRTLSQQDQAKILSLVGDGRLFLGDNLYLPYFLAKLILAYRRQRELDESLQSFVDICSDYFTNKVVVYNEDTIDVEFVSRETGNSLDINDLSSGEKQITSLFSQIYLYGKKPFILLFDEPELSLSVEWQERLLPDITRSKECRFLLAMTHSPFIFTNMRSNTSDLDHYIEHNRRVLHG